MAKVNLVTRIESNLKDRLGEVAQVQNRTTSNMVEWLIKQYLEQLAKRSTAPMELDFASPDELHSVLDKRHRAIADALNDLNDK